MATANIGDFGAALEFLDHTIQRGQPLLHQVMLVDARKKRAVPQNRHSARSFQSTPLPVLNASEILGSSSTIADMTSPMAPIKTGLSSSAKAIFCSGCIWNLPVVAS